MKHFIILFIFLLSFNGYAQKTIPKYPQKDFILYKGGPSLTLDSWGLEHPSNDLPYCGGVWSEGILQGGAGNLENVFDLSASNDCKGSVTFTTAAPFSTLAGVIGYWQIPAFNASVSIATTATCEFTLTESSKLYRGRFYTVLLVNKWHTPVLCKDTALIVHNVKIVEPIAFSSTAITSICANAPRINLRKYVTDTTGVFSGVGVENGFYFNPSLVPYGAPGIAAITYSKDYDNFKGYSVSHNITINPTPLVNPGAAQEVCKNSDLALQSSTPGGEWSSPYVKGSSFSGTLAPVGTYTIDYSITSANGCKGSATKSVLVKPLPTVSPGAPQEVCRNVSPIPLTGATPGGTWSGIGVDTLSAIFNPALAGPAKTITVSYRLKDPLTLCSAEVSKNIIINEPPQVTIQKDTTVCANTGNISLKASPENGKWTADKGLSNNILNPLVAGSGPHIIIFNAESASGCKSSAQTTVTVNPAPIVTAGDNLTKCSNDPSIALTGGLPNNGSYSGKGISNNIFNPAMAAIGANTIAYNYTDLRTGCSGSATRIITVNPAPVITVGSDTAICLNSPLLALRATPEKGTWSGTAVANSGFDPKTAGVGTYPVTYSVSTLQGCTTVATKKITVNPIPVVTVMAPFSICENALPMSLTASSNAGTGKWSSSSPALSGNIYIPSKEKSLSALLTYTVTDLNNCSDFRNTAVSILKKPVAGVTVNNKGCISQATVALTGGKPVNNGQWLGKGITENIFPVTAYGIGRHQVQYTVADSNNCRDTTTTYVAIYGLPSVSAGRDTAACEGHEPIDLNVNPDLKPRGGKWYYNGSLITNNQLDISKFPRGSYSALYVYTDTNFCSNKDSIVIGINPIPVKPVVIGKSDYCYGEEVQLYVPASPIYAVRFTDLTTKSVLTTEAAFKEKAIRSRQVNVEYLNSLNCPSLPSIVNIKVENPNGIITVTKDSISYLDYAEFNFSGDTTNRFTWRFTNTNIRSIESSPHIYFYKEGFQGYTLEVVTSIGCKASYKKDSAVYIRKYTPKALPTDDQDTHYDPKNAPFAIRYSPNPVSAVLTIQNLNGSLINPYYFLYNSLGIVVKEGSEYNKIDMTELSSGAYLLILKSNNFNQEYKVVKE